MINQGLLGEIESTNSREGIYKCQGLGRYREGWRSLGHRVKTSELSKNHKDVEKSNKPDGLKSHCICRSCMASPPLKQTN